MEGAERLETGGRDCEIREKDIGELLGAFSFYVVLPMWCSGVEVWKW